MTETVSQVAAREPGLVHDLKCWPRFFEGILSGEKTWELRHNDRGFVKGDYLDLHEWDPFGSPGSYTGRRVLVQVTYVVSLQGVVPNHDFIPMVGMSVVKVVGSVHG